MTNQRKSTSVFVVVALIVVAVVSIYMVGEANSPYEDFFDELFLAIDGDTVFAPGYTQSGFGSIRVGMSEAQVRATLGEPLQSSMSNGEVVDMWYSHSPNSTHYRQRGFILRGGVVTKVIAEMYWD